MKKILFLIMFVFVAHSAHASNFGSSARGTTAAEFLELGVGARAVSMGEAFSAVADDASALYWNPAALTNIEKKSATFMHAAYIENSYFDYAAYGQNLGDWGAFGGGVQYFSAGSLTQTDATTGEDLGQFTPYDLAATLGYAYKLKDTRFLDNFSLGFSAKFIQSKIISQSAKTGAVDVGLLSPRYISDRIRFALTATNIGGKMKFDQTAESLPMAFRVGSSYLLTKKWQFALDVGFPKNDNPYAALGTEYQLLNKGPWAMAARAGFNSQTVGSIDGFSGASFGLGLGYEGFKLDYGFAPMGTIGLTHRVSLTYNF